MLTINHGIPKSDYFMIAVPPSTLQLSLDRKENEIILLKDPKTGEEVKAELVDCYTFTMDEFLEHSSFSLLAYSLPASKMATVLRAKYPEIDQTNKMRYPVLKKL